MTWPPAGIKWAYADEFTALAHGDTFLLTPQIRAAVKFDHVITDPPYSENTHKNAQTNADKAQGKKLMTFDSITVEKLREFFGSFSVERWVIATMEWRHVGALEAEPPNGLKFLRFGVWVKTNGMPQISADRPAQGWEAIAYMHSRREASRWNGGGKSGNYVGAIEPGKHPTNKPLPLLMQFVRQFTDNGEVIFDPFAGGGTTLVAAKKMGRRAIGIELDAEHVETCSERLKATKQTHFDGERSADKREQQEFL